jgi:hypothetical protein
MKTLSKKFQGKYKPLNYHSSIDITIEVDFIGIDTQAELDQLIDDGESYDYKVKAIWGIDNDSYLVDFKGELSGDIIHDKESEMIDNIISDELFYEEQKRKLTTNL